MSHAIEVDGLTRAFGESVAVDRLSLRVPWGRIYGFLGLNGAGKSTTIKMLATLLGPTAGRARVAGHDVVDEPLAVRASIGLVGDEGATSRPSWTAREYMGYFARARGLPRAEADRLLDVVGLPAEKRGRAIATYSTGMCRRLEIARALLGGPRVLFLDEPTRGLDIPAKRETWALLEDLVDGGDVTVFLSSHEAAEIQLLCDELAVIARGRLTYAGPSAALARHAEGFDAALVELLEGRRDPEGSSGAAAKPANIGR